MNFNIETLERNTDDGVVVAHWRVNKAQGENVASAYGTVSFTPDPSAEGYVPYADLTQATVIGWVQAAIDTDALEASLDADLAEQASPSIITGTPW
jgi:hypothetical protein|tara:strand:+ start:1858 stop:2145 length:288 start_codon:yes stop_codon:yes gene_type:complete